MTILVLAAILAVFLPPRFIAYNASPSVEIGFYVRVTEGPEIGQFAEFPLPLFFRTVYPHCPIFNQADMMILKPIAAGPGDLVDTTGDWLFINDQRMARIKTQDTEGRPVPVWRARRVLGKDEFFMFSSRVPNSLDSRYFGPIHRHRIRAVRAPLLTW